MPTRDGAPLGSPCWIDLWTSDVEASAGSTRSLRMESSEPSQNSRLLHVHPRRVPVAGCMARWATSQPTTAGRSTWPPTTSRER